MRDRARAVSLVVAGLAVLGALAVAAAPSTAGSGPATGTGTARSAVEAPVSALGAVPLMKAPRSGGVDAVIAYYRSRIPQLMRDQHVPGLAVAVVDRDHVLWQQGFGTTDTGEGPQVTADTIFSVQSMSKTFTATAVMAAVQAGRVSLDVPITTYLPTFTVHSAFEQHPERRITLRMLLSCTAGFTHEAPLGNNYTPEVGSFDTHVASISDTWLRFPVGTGFAYSNEGFDLAGRVLEQVYGKPFPTVVHDLVLAPLGMDHSTFDRATVHATTTRAVGHKGDVAPARVDSPMMAAGGLWASASDLARFLRFQLGDGTVGGRTVLAARLVRQMRTVLSSAPSTTAGYALGISRTRWQAARYTDLFNHGGGGEGFLSDLWFAPQVGLGVAVLTNSDDNSLQVSLAVGIMNDLAVQPTSPYAERVADLPPQPTVLPRGGDFVPPEDLARRIAALALPASAGQAARRAAYPPFYRAGQLGAMDPTKPASRFHVTAGVPYFDAGEDGALVRHRLTEFRPGLFLAENGETLDLRASSRSWRGIDLHAVTNGPLAWQWAILAVAVGAILAWLVLGARGLALGWRARRARSRSVASLEVGPTSREPGPAGGGVGPPGREVGRRGRLAIGTVALVAGLAAVGTVAAVWVVPGLVDVGFLGRTAAGLPLRLALHLPLAVVLLTLSLAALVAVGARRRWWATAVRARDVVLVLGLAALCVQLGAWHLVGWGF